MPHSGSRPRARSPARGWDAFVCRIVTWAPLRREGKQDASLCISIRTSDHLGRRARRQESAESSAAKRKEIRWQGAAGGDGRFQNSSAKATAPYHILDRANPICGYRRKWRAPQVLKDTFAQLSEQLPEGPSRTFLGLLGLMGLGRIDYIFVNNGFRAVRHRVVEAAGRPSDHRPVIAEIEFGG